MSSILEEFGSYNYEENANDTKLNYSNLNKWIGQYFGNYKRINCVEIGTLEIELQNNNLIFKSLGQDQYDNGYRTKTEYEEIVFNIDKQNKDYVNNESDNKIDKCYFANNNKIVCEYKCNNDKRSAQTFMLSKNKLIREIYINYIWKSPFGKFWFSETYEQHIWHKREQ